MKLYTSPHSTALVTEAVIAQLGLDCEMIQLNITKGDTNSPDFLAKNPNGRVPTLELDDGTIIYESGAITLFLGETYGVGKNVFPELGSLRGIAMQWIVWTAATMAPIAQNLAAQLSPNTAGSIEPGDKDFLNDETLRTPEMLQRSQDELTNCYRIVENVLEQAFEGHCWILGEKYSLVDTHVYTMFGWVSMLLPLGQEFCRVQAWMES